MARIIWPLPFDLSYTNYSWKSVEKAMIRYFKYARDLKEVIKFKQLLKDFCKFQDDVEKEYLKKNRDFGFYSPREVQVLIQIKCNDKNPAKYQLMRSAIAEKIPRICRIANHLGVQTERHNYLTWSTKLLHPS